MNPAGRVMKFSEGQKLFLNSLKTAFETNNFKALGKTFDSLSTTDNDNKKLTMDQIFREFLTNNFKALEKTFDSLSTTDNDNKKLTMDQVFREFLTKELLPASITPQQADCERLVE